MYTHTFLIYIQVKFPSPGFLSSQKLKELAKLLPAPEEPMHTNDDYYEEVQYTCACTVTGVHINVHVHVVMCICSA